MFGDRLTIHLRASGTSEIDKKERRTVGRCYFGVFARKFLVVDDQIVAAGPPDGDGTRAVRKYKTFHLSVSPLQFGTTAIVEASLESIIVFQTSESRAVVEFGASPP